MAQAIRKPPAKMKRFRVPPENLATACDPAQFAFETTAEVTPLQQGIIGQERAVKAIDFGLRVRHPGYNLFLTGPIGTGKTTYTRTRVGQIAAEQPTPPDWCYVYNFKNPDQPLCFALPPGRGLDLRRDMAELIEDLRTTVRKAFDSEDWERRRGELVERFEKAINEHWARLEATARARGFAIQRTPTGIFTIPLKGENPMTPEEFAALPEATRKEVAAESRELQAEVAETLRHVRNLEKEARGNLKQLESETGLYAVEYLFSQVRERYEDVPAVVEYLKEVQRDVVDNLENFRSDSDEPPLELPPPLRGQHREHYLKYRVNLFVDNSETTGAPVVFETNPTYYNLFGKVEYRSDFGTLVTDFTMIKPGAIHLANGGYLVIQANDLLGNPLSWAALKRTLETGKARIENLGDQLGLVATTGLKPSPLPLSIKVIIVGDPIIYQLLYTYDPGFRKFFKVRADFDTEMDRSFEHMQLYASFISCFCTREGLRHLTPAAVARVIDYSSRLADDQTKLSTRFHEVTELLLEASTWAEDGENPLVGPEHVDKAVEERVFRSNRIEEKVLEMIAEGTLMVDTDGGRAGQVNGLAILDLGDYVFGKPNRITARVYLGEKGVVNIEREAEMSGPIHSKGIYILSAYLAGKYAQDKPLALSASLCFEQLYEEVEGDSASSTELYALLSELSGLPIDQGLAVTGSVNQKGEIQPIAGINEKIEGFFHVCRTRGLTGEQGVIIPHQNVRNLMLKREVRQAAAAGLFHIYAIRTIDEGMEILTGFAAGERREDGGYPEGTINHLVDQRLEVMADTMRRFGQDCEEEKS